MKKIKLTLFCIFLGVLVITTAVICGPNPKNIKQNLRYSIHELISVFKEESSYPEYEDEKEESAESDLSGTDSLDEEPESIPSTSEDIRLKLVVLTSEADLYIAVRDSIGAIVNDVFTLTVMCNNSKNTYKTNDKGTIYVNDLSAGTYKVSMKAKTGYETPDPVNIDVVVTVEKKPIANIKEKINVKISTPANNYEITGSRENADQGDIIDYSEEPDFNHDKLSEGSTLETDSIYNYQLGPHGYLNFADGTESEVRPVLINGLLAYGERDVYTLVEGTTDDYTYNAEKVTLFDNKGKPVSDYAIKLIKEDPDKLIGWQYSGGKTYYYNTEGVKVTGYVKIDGKHYYFDSKGVKASSLVIDVSEWQNVTSWANVKNAGIDGVIIRIGGRGYGSGSIYSDDKALSYIRTAKAAGLKIGIYFFSSAINAQEAVEEASWVISELNGLEMDYPIFIDMEHSGNYPKGRADKLTRAQHTSVATSFCDTIIASGYEAGVYAGYYYFQDELSYSAVKKYTIWLANYTTGYKMTTFPYAFDIWQFTPRAYVSGISGQVDLNVIF